MNISNVIIVLLKKLVSKFGKQIGKEGVAIDTSKLTAPLKHECRYRSDYLVLLEYRHINYLAVLKENNALVEWNQFATQKNERKSPWFAQWSFCLKLLLILLYLINGPDDVSSP